MIKEDKEDNKIAIIITAIIIVAVVAGLTVFANYTNNKTARENFIEAQDLFRKSKLQQAEKLLDVKPPKDIAKEFYELKFNVLFQLNSPYAAKEAIQELLKLEPENAFYNYELSLIYYNLQDNEQTEKFLKEALRLEPNNFTYNISLANYYSEQGKYDEAIKIYLEIYKKNPKAQLSILSVANCYEQKNDMVNTLKYREEAVQAFPSNLYFVYVLAKTYEQMNKKDKAIQYYAKAIDLDSEENTDAKEKYKKLSGKKYYPKGYDTILVPYQTRNNLMYVKANLGGRTAEFILDTGASFCVISEKFAKSIKTRNLGINAVATLANGSKANAPLVLANLTLGGIDLGEVLTFILPDINGMNFLIGNNVMQELDYHIDNDSKNIIIKRDKK